MARAAWKRRFCKAFLKQRIPIEVLKEQSLGNRCQSLSEVDPISIKNEMFWALSFRPVYSDSAVRNFRRMDIISFETACLDIPISRARSSCSKPFFKS